MADAGPVVKGIDNMGVGNPSNDFRIMYQAGRTLAALGKRGPSPYPPFVVGHQLRSDGENAKPWSANRNNGWENRWIGMTSAIIAP